jgi:hypothetical protein
VEIFLVLIFSGLEGATDDEENNSQKRPQNKSSVYFVKFFIRGSKVNLRFTLNSVISAIAYCCTLFMNIDTDVFTVDALATPFRAASSQLISRLEIQFTFNIDMISIVKLKHKFTNFFK